MSLSRHHPTVGLGNTFCANDNYNDHTRYTDKSSMGSEVIGTFLHFRFFQAIL